MTPASFRDDEDLYCDRVRAAADVVERIAPLEPCKSENRGRDDQSPRRAFTLIEAAAEYGVSTVEIVAELVRRSDRRERPS